MLVSSECCGEELIHLFLDALVTWRMVLDTHFGGLCNSSRHGHHVAVRVERISSAKNGLDSGLNCGLGLGSCTDIACNLILSEP